MSRFRAHPLAALACAVLGCTAINPAYEGGGLGGEGSGTGDETTATTASSVSATTTLPPGTGSASSDATTDSTTTTSDATSTGSTSDEPPPASSSGDAELPRVLLVTQLGDLSLPLDATLASTLESLGLEVMTIEDEVVTAADADGVELVVISETVTALAVGAKLREVARPTIVLEGDIWNDMSMAPFGNAMLETVVFIASKHPIAAELSGEVMVLTEDPGSGLFGTLPPPTAQVVAHASNAVGPIAVFAFEAGVPMEGGFPAPAARVGMGFDVDRVGASTGNLTAAGATMFAAAVQWALP